MQALLVEVALDLVVPGAGADQHQDTRGVLLRAEFRVACADQFIILLGEEVLQFLSRSQILFSDLACVCEVSLGESFHGEIDPLRAD